MTKYIFPLYLVLGMHLQNGTQWVSEKRAQLHARCGDKGASALEYAGVVVVGAAIIGFLAWAINETDVGEKMKTGITDILEPDIDEK